MAEEELELDVNQPKGSKTTTILIVIIAMLVLVMGGVGAWLFLGSDDGGDSSDSAKKEEKVLEPLKYLTLTPEFVVNFGPDSKVRYLQVDLQIATRDEAALETISTYRPVLRNDILIVLSSVKFENLKERSGKEVLQKKLLNTINKVVVSAHAAPADDNAQEKNEQEIEMKKEEGPIENVYFTSFIMQ